MLFVLGIAAQAHAQTQKRPNIVLLYADDHAAHAISAYRPHLPYAFPLPATPNIDRLARTGMLFTNAFATNSICGPARAAVLTGEYGHLSGVLSNFDSLHQNVVTFPKLLGDHGYQTALIGKWHLKDRPSGFQHYEILVGQGSYYNPRVLTETTADTLRLNSYSQEVLTDRSLKWLQARDAKKPFFLMLAFNAPHRPWESGPNELSLYRDHDLAEAPTLFDDGAGRAFRAQDQEMTIAQDLIDRDLKLVDPVDMSEEQLAPWRKWYDPENAAFAGANLSGAALTRWKYQRFIKDYMRAVQGIDANVGRVLEALDHMGLADNTLVIYSSDQGFFLGDHGWFDKRWMYEESIRTPLVMRWPRVIKPNSVNRQLVMNLDFAQTFLDLAGVRAPSNMQGLSIAPLLRGRTSPWRDAIYYQYFGYPDWHMVQRQYGVRDSRYKLIRYYEVDKWEMFDLRKDPHEMKNVYGDARYSATVTRLKKKLDALRAQYQVPEHDPAPHVPFELPAEYRRKN